ncbi:MAG: D-glycero-alpha-D-manno-heptose-1,7-bisphosphate 7-phosphatase [Candidatus Binatia bacterium]
MTGSTNLTPAVFVDRDGTLIREVGYLNCVEQVEVLPRVPEAIQLLHQQGLKVAVITNQSGVARGFLREEMLEQIHDELKRQLARCGAFLDGIYYCPHHPTEGLERYRVSCECRKPNIGLAKRAEAGLNLNLSQSYVVGDQERDMELADRIGAKGILIKDARPKTGDRGRESDDKTNAPVLGLPSPVLVVQDLWEAAQWIIRDLRAKRKD